MRVSNPGPLLLEPDALPTELPGVPEEGFLSPGSRAGLLLFKSIDLINKECASSIRFSLSPLYKCHIGLTWIRI